MKWSMPAEPPSLERCWRKVPIGDSWIEWVKAPMPTTGNKTYWRRANDTRELGPGVWHTWRELFLDGSIVTDENPNPKPPQMVWSPSLDTVYAKDGGVWVRVWGHGSAGVRADKPADAMPMWVES